MHSWNSNNACCDKNDCNHKAASVTNQIKISSGNRWTTVVDSSSSDTPSATNTINELLSNQKTNSLVLNNPFIVNAVLNGDRICGRRCQMSLRNSERLTDECCDMSNKNVISDDTACDVVRSDKYDEKTNRRSSVDKFVEETLAKKIIPSNVVLHEDDLSNIDVKSLVSTCFAFRIYSNTKIQWHLRINFLKWEILKISVCSNLENGLGEHTIPTSLISISHSNF